ncbi:hypothetical protein FRC09_017782 [Ceratobasidium sp. 395]|nr:hypothetical protein FRC09_017782 [Ceratobasidium sp. 395]
MRLSYVVPISTILAIAPVWGWGEEGHKITGTIAQIHLLPSTQQAICDILPQKYKCNLANVATWADEVKRHPEWKWSSELHYVNPTGDHPPDACLFGEKGWDDPDENVLVAIVNNTRHLLDKTPDTQDIAIRFLTHFLGDLHQPFHLTGRALGANHVPVLYQSKHTNLHAVWDGDLIRHRIRTLNNYTTPLPTAPTLPLPPPTLAWNRRIESALQGSSYDPLVRWIVSEGVLGWWADDVEEWTQCDQLALQGAVEQVAIRRPPFDDPSDLPVCPYHWSKASQQLLCDFLWRPEFKDTDEDKHARAEIDLETPEYAGHIRDIKLIEKQLALGGFRLAAVLNAIFGSEEEKQEFGVRAKAL